MVFFTFVYKLYFLFCSSVRILMGFFLLIYIFLIRFIWYTFVRYFSQPTGHLFKTNFLKCNHLTFSHSPNCPFFFLDSSYLRDLLSSFKGFFFLLVCIWVDDVKSGLKLT